MAGVAIVYPWFIPTIHIYIYNLYIFPSYPIPWNPHFHRNPIEIRLNPLGTSPWTLIESDFPPGMRIRVRLASTKELVMANLWFLCRWKTGGFCVAGTWEPGGTWTMDWIVWIHMIWKCGLNDLNILGIHMLKIISIYFGSVMIW